MDKLSVGPVVVVVVGIMLSSSSLMAYSANPLTPLELGLIMVVRAYDVVCWYEKLKHFPRTNGETYTTDCFGHADYVRRLVPDEETVNMYFAEWFKSLAMVGLPSDYRYGCRDYLKNADKEFPFDEGEALNDGQTEPYPYQGFSYCLLNTLRNKHGSEAIDAVKNEKTHTLKHWMNTILDRQNEFRAHHRTRPLQLVEELTVSAQQWADKLANDCKLIESTFTSQGRQFNGNTTGESIVGGTLMPAEDSALLAADIWYEEKKEYPFEAGYNGNGYDNMFGKFSHFTQTVWRGTKYVGYGYSVNKSCNTSKFYLVARYSPPGNYIGKFQRNVAKPVDYVAPPPSDTTPPPYRQPIALLPASPSRPYNRPPPPPPKYAYAYDK